MITALRPLAALALASLAACMPQAHMAKTTTDMTPTLTYVANTEPRQEALAPPPMPDNTVAWPQMTMGKRASAWSPWFTVKQNLTREEFARAIERDDRKILRVEAAKYAEIWGNLGLPTMANDPRQLATLLRSSDVTVVTCTAKIVNDLYLARVDKRSGEIDFNYVRKGCLPGEQFLAYKGEIFVSLGCGNPARTRVPPPPMAVAPPPTDSCPDVYILKVNVWPPQAQQHPGVAQAMSAAEVNRTMWDANRVSRKYGGELRKRAENDPDFQRSETPRLMRLSLINVDEKDRITKEQYLGEFEVTGLRVLKFARAQLAWDAIRIVDIREEMSSPALHSVTSLREFRFYNTSKFQGLPMGEWSTNPVDDCIMNIHAIEAKDGDLTVRLF